MRGRGPSEPLFERSGELVRIGAALADASDGHGRFVVIEGPPGIGKTALLAAARAAASEGGMRVLRGRGTVLERDFAFGVVRQLFEPLLAEAAEDERAKWLRAAGGGASVLFGPPGAPVEKGPASPAVDPSFAILHGLYWLCANLAATDPLCVVVDDAHWADSPSLRFLAFLLTRLDELSVALVVASRPREADTYTEALATVTTDPSGEVIRLPPLTRAAVGQFVESRLGETPEPAFVEACLHATRGTPFLLSQLLQPLSHEGIAPTAGAAGEVERIGARTVGRSIRLRIDQLPAGAGRFARALAILEQADLLQAARLAGLTEAEAAAAAEQLEGAGIVDYGRPLTFAHPIVRSGIYSELSVAERTTGHRRAAQLIAEQPVEHAHVAEHLIESEPAGDPWVVDRLVEAARTAARHGAPESVSVYLRRALEEPPPLADQQAMLLELGMAEASAGLSGWEEHLERAVATAPDPASAVSAAMVLAAVLSRAQHFARAVEVLDRAASALDPRESELAVRLTAAAVVPGINDPATAATARSRGEALRARADADPSARPEIVAIAAFSSVLANEPAAVGAALATRALRGVTDPTAASVAQPWASFAAWFSPATLSLLWTEHYAQVRPLLDESITQARLTGDSSRLAMALANRAWLSLRRGDPSAAEEDAATALGATELPAPPAYRVLNGGLLVESLVEQGRLDDAEQALALLDSETEKTSLVAAALRFARGRLRVEQGRARDGLEDFLAVGVLLERATVRCPSYLPWRSEAALAHLVLGDREPAERLAAEELELALAFGTPRALGVALRAAGLAAGGERADQQLREAIESFEHGDAELERARALTDLGALLRRRNRRVEAREQLREALDIAHRSGARRLAERAETELRATGARPRRVVLTGLESLTASERRIAELACGDLTNREIAQALFITTRTVEGHLTSVFRKLRLDSRHDLAAALAGDNRVPAP